MSSQGGQNPRPGPRRTRHSVDTTSCCHKAPDGALLPGGHTQYYLVVKVTPSICNGVHVGETRPELKQTLVLSYDTTCLAKYTLASASLLPAPREPFRAVLELSLSAMQPSENQRTQGRRDPRSGTRIEAGAEESEEESGKERGEQESKTGLFVQHENPAGASPPRVVQGPLTRPRASQGRTWRTHALAEQREEPE